MYKAKSIKELRKLLDDKKVTKEELFEESTSLAKKYQEDYNSFVTILDKFKSKDSDSILDGIPYSLKDNFSTSNILTTASSNILKDYIPVYDATIYKKLKKAGATLIGKTTLDELAMGGTGTTAATGIVRNPYDKERLIGGSSAGAASSVALGITPFAIGSDTGDSVRKPASFGGIVGFKPTYGRISRYGLFAFASSLDHVGILTRNVEDAAIVTDVLKGKDENDMTTLKTDRTEYATHLEDSIKGKKLFYIKEICNLEEYPKQSTELKETLSDFKVLLDKCRELGFIVEEVSIDKKLLEAIYPTYMTISCAEATSNMSNLTGIIFGPRGEGKTWDEQVKDYRTKGFSSLIKRRFVIGSYVLQSQNQERYFRNAQRVRRLLVDAWKDLFKKYDAVILPVGSGPAKKLDGDNDMLSKETVTLEEHLQVGNFGGFPSITIPDGFINNLPVALNITGNCYDDENVLNIAYALEGAMDYKNQIAKEVE